MSAPDKFHRMVEAWSLYLTHPNGLTDDHLAEHFNCDRTTIVRLRQEFGEKMKRVKHGYYTIEPDNVDIALAQAILARLEK